MVHWSLMPRKIASVALVGKQNSKYRSCRLKCEPLSGNCRIILHNDSGRKMGAAILLSVTTVSAAESDLHVKQQAAQ